MKAQINGDIESYFLIELVGKTKLQHVYLWSGAR